jgi:tRNA (cmo5U34)-methyltransferase
MHKKTTRAEDIRTIPEEWTFKADEVAENFDAHVRSQLPWYDLATRAVAHIARHYIPPSGGLVYDLGASNGNIGRALAKEIVGRGADYVAIDDSEEMVAKFDAPGRIVCADVSEFEFEPFDVAVCFLCLMFVPLAKRGRLITKLKRAAKPGAVIVIVDKDIGPSGYPSVVLHRMTLAMKAEAGVAPELIVAKEMSLGGIQRPSASKDIRDLLPHPPIDFFRFGEFYGVFAQFPEHCAYVTVEGYHD